MRWARSIAVVSGIVAMLLLRTPLADVGPGAQETGGSAANETQRILIVGDSLSAEYGLPRGSGWVHHVERRLEERDQAYQIRNASISGDTTLNGLRRLPPLLDEFRPDIVIIQLGANDGLRGFPVSDIKANLEQMIDLSKTAGARVLLVGQHIPPNYGRRYAESFHAVYAELASAADIALVPFMLDEIAMDPAMFQADGLHPTEEAQALIAKTIWPYLEPLLH